jgi:hypothetical protein
MGNPISGATKGRSVTFNMARYGPFTFVGQVTIINPYGKWLLQSPEKVDGWIDRLTVA